MELFDLEVIDEYSPFEFDTQAPHLFKHPGASMDTVLEVWHADPVFYKAEPPAHWLMLAELGGRSGSFRWHRLEAVTRTSADPSAATSQAHFSRICTGGIDDHR